MKEHYQQKNTPQTPKENTFDRYQSAARVTRLPSADESYALLGLSGEVGELHSHIAKYVRDGSADDVAEALALQQNVAKELGDILWFVSAIADDFNISLSTIVNMNLQKLIDRKNRGTLGGSGDNR